MGGGFLARLANTSIAARVFVGPLIGLALTVSVLLLLDHNAGQALSAIDTMHQSAARRNEKIDRLFGTAYLIHSDVSRHLALSGSGLEDEKLQAMRDLATGNLDKARKILAELREAPLTPVEARLLDDIITRLGEYAEAVDSMNQMAAIDRLIAIPLMAHVDEQFIMLAGRITAAQTEIGAGTARATQDTRDATAEARARFWMIAGVILAVMIGGNLVVARTITRPLAHLTDTTGLLADGHLSVQIDGTAMRNEIGAMARALRVFRDNALAMEQLKAEQQRQTAQAEAERHRALHEVADLFEARVAEVVLKVGSGAGQVRGNAAHMLARANSANAQATAVATASQQAEANVQTAAASAEELSASIAEIGGQVRRSFTMVRGAVEAVEHTNSHVAGLSEAADRIGRIVQLINSIASQTNLLALNATIEAARAGDAGKGFAVVANEVKVLSNQIAHATDDITTQIVQMQQVTSSAVGAIKGIGGTVTAIDEVVSSIAASMEQQSAATSEIARAVQEAAVGTSEVSHNIAGVAHSAGATGTAAGEVLQAAELLDGQASTLNTEVKQFIGRLRQG